MYENLIEQLRACSCAVSCEACPYGDGGCEEDLMKDAAKAIEKLSKEQWQAEGLMMIRDGLKSQMNLTKHRLKHLEEMKKTETKEYVSLTTAFKFQSYWFEEADKALNGDLHF